MQPTTGCWSRGETSSTITATAPGNGGAGALTGRVAGQLGGVAVSRPASLCPSGVRSGRQGIRGTGLRGRLPQPVQLKTAFGVDFRHRMNPAYGGPSLGSSSVADGFGQPPPTIHLPVPPPSLPSLTAPEWCPRRGATSPLLAVRRRPAAGLPVCVRRVSRLPRPPRPRASQHRSGRLPGGQRCAPGPFRRLSRCLSFCSSRIGRGMCRVLVPCVLCVVVVGCSIFR